MSPCRLAPIYLILFSITFCACKKIQLCNLPTDFNIITVSSQPCSGSGTLTIQAPPGTDLLYQLGNSLFQTQPIFSSLRPGTYRLTIKDNLGCQVIREIKIDTVARGENFANVVAILANRCKTCHEGNNPQAGLNFTSICDIINHCNRIEARAIFGNPSPMPPTGLIPYEEQSKIMQWINAGHGYDK